MRISDWSSDVCSSDLRSLRGWAAPVKLNRGTGLFALAGKLRRHGVLRVTGTQLLRRGQMPFRRSSGSLHFTRAMRQLLNALRSCGTRRADLIDIASCVLRKGRHAYQRGDADKGETRHADGAPAPLSNHALLIHLSPFICREGIACSYRFTTFQADQCSAQMENA